MKKFFEKYSYESVRLFLNQFAISLFGLTLGIASQRFKPLSIATSIASIVFYLFMQYTVAWNVGAKDKVSIDCGNAKKDLKIPVFMWLLANVVNFLIAICFTVGFFLENFASFESIRVISSVASWIFEGEYFGIMTIAVGNWKLLDLPPFYFAITLPSLIIVLLGYIMGLKGIAHLNFLGQSYPDSDSPKKKRQWFTKK